MSDNNPEPFLNEVAIIQQLIDQTSSFKKIMPVSAPDKFISQIKTKPSEMPALGVSLEFGDVTENITNSSMLQVMEIDIMFTVVLNTQQDLTGGTPQISFISLWQEISHAILNWQPSKNRYLNGFQQGRFERIAPLCDDVYEVYTIIYSIPIQIDYLDGFLTEGQKLVQIQTQMIMNNKLNINIQNN